ncbi:MAG: GNAT family N-acetyltransferase [Flavobacteriales bacterium]|nr:GNAT family N-acetyltransferase [Flavobacteriales bacterium]MBL0037226.1 GNAT family N-acetyltransferase [Flavobacteriales bacterium]
MSNYVIITPLVSDDADGLLQLINAERIDLATYFPVTTARMTDHRSAKRYVGDLIDKAKSREMFCFILRDHEGGEPAGAVFLKQLDWSVPKCEIAYFVGSTYRRQGFATYGVIWAVDHAFSVLGLDKVYARVDPENKASLSVLESCGFQQEGLLRHDFRTGDGRLLDVCYYGKLRE